MPYTPLETSREQDEVLERSLMVCERDPGLAVIDIDGVLFDTRHRQIRIVREYAERMGFPELLPIRPEHFEDWSMKTTFIRMGLPQAQAESFAKMIRPFWEEQFFGPTAVLWDEALPGASRWVSDLQDRGATIVYLTGRTESQREATLAAFERERFPVLDTQLVMKAQSSTADHLYKASALEEIALQGRVVLGIDNEPIQINQFAQRFPDAMAIWMNTDHSFRPDVPREDLPVLKGFLMREAN